MLLSSLGCAVQIWDDLTFWGCTNVSREPITLGFFIGINDRLVINWSNPEILISIDFIYEELYALGSSPSERSKTRVKTAGSLRLAA